MSHPDWGHGQHEPVPMFTEVEIRTVMKEHGPTDVDCECSCSPMEATLEKPYVYFTDDHLIDKLKEYRYGKQAQLHPNFG